MIRRLKLLLTAVLACFCIAGTMGQTGTLTGTITDKSSGESLPGANVMLKGTTLGSFADADGNFQLEKVPAGEATLVFSFMGYISQEQTVTIEANKTSNLQVKLEAENTQLSDVVVIGYGSVKKSDATGSVTAVTSEDFNKGAITSPSELLVGKSAGVVITSNSGAPGSGATIRIRGGSSLTASNDPLIIIDGVPLDNSTISGIASPLSSINPNDIETFTVLKDASATAIYGSRASNGVVIITTKKGTKKLKIGYSGNVSVSVLPATLDVMSGDEFRQMMWDKYKDNSSALSLVGTANTDWQKEIFQVGIGHDHNINVTGTQKGIPFRVAVGYTDQNGLLKKSNFKRATASLGLTPTFLNGNLSVNVNVKGMYTKSNFSNDGAIGNAVSFDPTQPVNTTNQWGNYFTWLDSKGEPIDQATDNPVAQIELTDNVGTVKRSIGNIQLDYKLPFISGLKANLNLGYDYTKGDGDNNSPTTAAWTAISWGENTKGIRKNYTQTAKNTLCDFYLNYAKELGVINSKFDFTAGYSYQHFYRDYDEHSGNWDGSYKDTTNLAWKGQVYLVSFFGRLNYTLADKYLITATLRDDGSSRFNKANRWGLFPSVAFAWKMNEESFIKSLNLFNDLKLRLGYGVTGQQDIGSYYPYVATYTKSNQRAMVQMGDKYYYLERPNAYVEDIKWEETTTYNAGLDFSILKGRFGGSFDVYKRITDDLLNEIPAAAGTNHSNYITTNVGSLEIKGYEIALNARPISRANTYLEVSTNFSYNESEITKLTAVSDPSYIGVLTGVTGGAVGNRIQIHSVGYPASSFFAYKQVYDANGNPVEGLYVDISGNGGNVASGNTNKYRYKKAAPDYTLGLSVKFHYGNWDASFSGRANIGNYVFNNALSSRASYENVYATQGFLNNLPTAINDTKFNKFQYFSDYYIENASFFRMDNINLSYTFPQLMNKKVSATVSATVQNAFVITKYSGLDPEVSNGIDNNIYPRPRVFMLGFSINF